VDKHLKTLLAVFSRPTPKNLHWREIESMLLSKGCILENGEGSRVTFTKNSKTLHMHRPHPPNDVAAYIILRIKKYLEQLGEAP
jgi:hypothetical protein